MRFSTAITSGLYTNKPRGQRKESDDLKVRPQTVVNQRCPHPTSRLGILREFPREPLELLELSLLSRLREKPLSRPPAGSLPA